MVSNTVSNFSYSYSPQSDFPFIHIGPLPHWDRVKIGIIRAVEGTFKDGIKIGLGRYKDCRRKVSRQQFDYVGLYRLRFSTTRVIIYLYGGDVTGHHFLHLPPVDTKNWGTSPYSFCFLHVGIFW